SRSPTTTGGYLTCAVGSVEQFAFLAYPSPQRPFSPSPQQLSSGAFLRRPQRCPSAPVPLLQFSPPTHLRRTLQGSRGPTPRNKRETHMFLPVFSCTSKSSPRRDGGSSARHKPRRNCMASSFPI